MTDPTAAVAPAAPRLLLGPAAGAPAVPRARAWEWLALGALAVGLLLPPLLCSEYRLSAFNRYLALAILALGVDLIWGYTGLLSLGQGVFFGLGAYSVALSLKLQKAAGSSGTLTLPDYMDWNGLTEVPAWIAPLFDVRLALLVAVGLPTL